MHTMKKLRNTNQKSEKKSVKTDVGFGLTCNLRLATKDSRYARGFTPSVEDGDAREVFSPAGTSSSLLQYNPFSRHFFMSHKKTSPSFTAGFTILETIVAVLILAISITSIVVVAGGGAHATIHNKDRLTAAYLAQEGVELVRNVRDTVFLLHEDDPDTATRWAVFQAEMDDCFDGGCTVAFAPEEAVPVVVSVDGSQPLLFNATTGTYGYDSGTETMFVRHVRMTEFPDGSILVVVSVDYREGTESRTYSTKEILFNWF